jgi:phage terminase large subunit GpA-like protein
VDPLDKVLEPTGDIQEPGVQQPALEFYDIDLYPVEKMSIRPPEDMTISEWSEKKRVLSDQSEEKGPLRLRRTPYFRPILDKAQEDDIEVVVLCKPAQVAGTETAISIIGYYSDQEPCPIMFVLADEDTAVYMSKERLQKMFINSPQLEYLSKNTRFGKTEITLANGAYISMAWASSVSKLASRPMRILILDEVDKPGYYVSTKEASPISLGIERTETFFRRKIFILSTPTIETGNITKEMEKCDVIYDWHVPCPRCGQFQPLRWSRKYQTGFEEGKYRGDDGKMHKCGEVRWEGGREATEEQIERAGYECGECGAVWDTAQKNNAVEKGKMVERFAPATKVTKVGYHLNRLYSLLGKSGDIPKLVRDYIDCLDDPKKLQGFVNSTLAEPWKMVVTRQSEAMILKARSDLPPQEIPIDAIALTCGIDPQKVGFWFVVRAWTRDFTSWLVHYGFLPDWIDIENLLFNTSYPAGDSGKMMRIWRAAIDTGGGRFDDDASMTEQAYWWIRLNGVGRGARVWATKGSARPLAGKVTLGKNLDRTPSGKPLPGGLQLIMTDPNQRSEGTTIIWIANVWRWRAPIGSGRRAASTR